MSGPTLSESDVLITRAHLASRLRAWQDGELSAEELMEWAAALFEEELLEFDDVEDEYNSAAKEVLSFVERIDMNLALPEDVPIHLKFLEAPLGEYEDAYEEWLDDLDEIDLDERRQRLRGVPPYARHLRDD